MTAKVRSHSLVLGLRQFSHSPAGPKGEPFFMAIVRKALDDVTKAESHIGE
jgi:hypothetical protein